jgi:myo-inositol-1(or 4)-monophosphatase
MPDYLTVCQEAVRRAGATLLDWMGKFSVRYKGQADLVTEADVAAQEIVRKIVLAAFSDHSLLGEEDTGQPRDEQSEYRWVVDPLDGTTNYVHGVPHFAVSLALVRGGRSLVGAIYDPSLDECFTAAAGGGAYLNGRRLHVSSVTRLADAVACMGFPVVVRPDSPDLLVFNAAAVRCQSVRRMGSASLNLAYLAAGRFDTVTNFTNKIWDVAAGWLLVEEAGGVMTAPDGGPFTLTDPRLAAAATPALHAQLLELVAAEMKK